MYFSDNVYKPQKAKPECEYAFLKGQNNKSALTDTLPLNSKRNLKTERTVTKDSICLTPARSANLATGAPLMKTISMAPQIHNYKI